jgi:sugar phosphate isomerase/epimerase
MKKVKAKRKHKEEKILSTIRSGRMDMMAAVKLGVSSYSFWHFRGDKYPIETVIERASALGVQGVEVLHRQMANEETPYLHRLKRHAFENGIDLICLSIHQNFISPDPEVRKTHIDHTIRCMQIAHEMGIPCIRLNSGRWGTIESFDRLMELRGDEPPLPGHTEDEAYAWCIDATEQCLIAAEKYGVLLALENHWGLTREPEGVLRIVDAIGSPWLSVLMDTGNFLEAPYGKLKKMADRASYVHAKTYYGGGEWYTLDLDYVKVAEILRAADYKGYVSLEFEGKEDPEIAVPKSVAMLRDAFEAVPST